MTNSKLIKEKLDRVKRRATIRTHIQNTIILPILSEQDDGSDYGGYDVADYAGEGGGGGWTGGGDSKGSMTDIVLNSQFAELFGLKSAGDIVKVAYGGARKILTKTVGETIILIKSLCFLLIPFIKPEDGDIASMAAKDRGKINNRLAKISKEYEDVLKKNEAVFNNPDFKLFAFVANPGLVVGGTIAETSIDVATDIYDCFVPGDEKVRKEKKVINDHVNSIMANFGYDPRQIQQEKEYRLDKLLEILKGNDAPDLATWQQLQRQKRLNRLFEQNNLAPQAQVPQAPQAQAPQAQAPQAQDPYNILRAAIASNPSPEIMAEVNIIINSINGIKNYIKSAEAVKKISTSSGAQKGRQFLINLILETAKNTFESFDFNALKSAHKTEIAQYLKSQAIEPAEQEKILNDPNFQNSVISAIKSALIDVYNKQLDAVMSLDQGSTPQMAMLVKNGKDMIVKMAEGIKPGATSNPASATTAPVTSNVPQSPSPTTIEKQDPAANTSNSVSNSKTDATKSAQLNKQSL
jgi:hypothetical protein